MLLTCLYRCLFILGLLWLLSFWSFVVTGRTTSVMTKITINLFVNARKRNVILNWLLTTHRLRKIFVFFSWLSLRNYDLCVVLNRGHNWQQKFSTFYIKVFDLNKQNIAIRFVKLPITRIISFKNSLLGRHFGF